MRAADDPAVVGQWDARVKWPAVAVHNILLHTGKVLFFRGDEGIPKAYLWNPLTEVIEQTPPPGDNIFCSGHSFLPDGRVLVTGGDTGVAGLRSRTLIFDPPTEQWIPGPIMRRGRYYPTNVSAGDGRVFIFSGKDEEPEKDIVEYVEVYVEPDGPGSGRWDLLPPSADHYMNYYPRMLLMPDGKIFHAGESPITELFDPVTNTWSFVAETNYTKRYEGTAVILPPGHERIMIVGGGNKSGTPTETAEIIDLSEPSPAWRYTAPMHYKRKHFMAVVLPDATVVVGGGTNNGTPIYPNEIFDPETETWTVVASQTSKRGYHSTALLLPDGRVLWAGANGNPSREIYSPPYLFRGPQPVITTAPGGVDYDEIFTVQTPDAFSIESVVFMRLGAPTHSGNMEQRYVPLDFAATDASTLEVLAPGNPNVAPPGYYMLFIVDGDGIPSKAPFVHLLPHAGVFATTTTTTTIVGPTTTTLPPLPVCGDGMVNQFSEDCDGGADTGCPGLCLSDCRCGVLMQGSIEADVTTDAGDPDVNFGTSTDLWADAQVAKTTFLRVSVSGTGAGTIGQAILRLHTGAANNAASDSGGRLHDISACDWDETTLTWIGRPAIDGALLGTLGAVSSSSTVDFDVTAAVAGDGTFCFSLDSLSENGVTYISREAASGAPELWITYRPEPVCVQGDPCDTLVPGVCAVGTQDCQGARPVCVQTVDAAPDDASCDGVDSDCDGATDEDYTITSTTCGGVGACRGSGKLECQNGVEIDTCTPGLAAASDTTCDNEDDDCDGSVDEDYVLTPTTCGAGACAVAGTIQCLAGIEEQTCAAGPPLASDDVTCDGVDDDCSGTADEDYVGPATTCGVGACSAAGQIACQNGAEVDTCSPGLAAVSDATCDGVDDDCDGTEDEDYVSTPTSCGVGACSAAGELQCQGGTELPICTPLAPLAADDATCDGVDDDCDGTLDEEACGAGAFCDHATGQCEALAIIATIVADATTEQDEPGTNFNDSGLRADADAPKASFLWINVSGIGGREVTGALLHLTVVGTGSADSNHGGEIHLTSCDWDETTITWNTRPAIDAAIIATHPQAVANGETVTFDLTGAITADGDHCFALTSPSTNSVTYQSRHTAAGPVLEISTLGAQGASTTTTSTTSTSTTTTTSSTTTTTAPAPPTTTSTTSTTTSTTTTLPPLGVCGDDVVNQAGEECDGTDDIDCPGGCLSSCRCPMFMLTGIEADVTAEADAANTNFGASTDLWADADKAKTTFLRARVNGVGEGTVIQALLRLYTAAASNAASNSGGRLHAISACSWEEDALTWTDRPVIDGPMLGTLDAVGSSTAVDFDVTAALTGDGAYCFALDSLSANGVVYRSREAATGGPELRITFQPAEACVPGRACDTGLPGMCAEGTQDCGGPDPVCVQTVVAAASDATCDGVDDDCNGAIDEDYPITPTTCGGVGACSAFGQLECQNGAEVDTCAPRLAAPNDTTCDGVDDDCDGTEDEDYVITPTSCGVGSCRATGERRCQAGAVLDTCTALAPLAADDTTCDGVDDDCDGATDEEACGAGEFCDTATGQCEALAIAATIVADASTEQKEPNTNFNGAALGADADAPKASFLWINVSGIGGRQVAEALLHVTVDGGSAESNHGGEIHLTSCDWDETTITWNTRPAIDGSVIATHPQAVTNGETVTFDLSGAITADGDHCFAMTSPSTDSVRYLSRETATGPVVEITAAGAQNTMTSTTSTTTTSTTTAPAVTTTSSTTTSTTSTSTTTLPAGVTTSVDVRVAASTDDAEEDAGLGMHVGSSDLELIQESTAQIVGVRFANLDIPPGAHIVSAYIQFMADETHDGPTSLVIQGEATDNAAAFTTAAGDISSRARTGAAVPWASIPPWAAKDVGPSQRTGDISDVIQEIVDRDGWARNNALAVIISGSGRRTAESFDGGVTKAPLLHVDYAP
jgi:hypothetical protein